MTIYIYIHMTIYIHITNNDNLIRHPRPGGAADGAPPPGIKSYARACVYNIYIYIYI